MLHDSGGQAYPEQNSFCSGQLLNFLTSGPVTFCALLAPGNAKLACKALEDVAEDEIMKPLGLDKRGYVATGDQSLMNMIICT